MKKFVMGLTLISLLAATENSFARRCCKKAAPVERVVVAQSKNGCFTCCRRPVGNCKSKCPRRGWCFWGCRKRRCN